MDDYYLNQRGLAAYFESQWLDKLRERGVNEKLECRSSPVPDSFLFSPYSISASQFIVNACQDAGVSPERVIEVGPALGRNCYEVIQSFPSIKSMTVVEPSKRLLTNLRRILVDGVQCEFPYIKGLSEIGYLNFDASLISEQCSHVIFKLVENSFTCDVIEDPLELVIYLNVLDQCESPTVLVGALKKVTDVNGILILSCTYQWSSKHLKDKGEAVDDINDYFGEGWVKLAEIDYEYKIRSNERYSLLFLSHAVAYQRVGV